MAAHELSVGKSDEWYTPPHVFDALGMTFDLDVAHPGREVAPWTPARQIITADSLDRDWGGVFVWMNPPFGRRMGIVPWLQKFVANGNGVALTPDRTSAPWFRDFARSCDLVLFCAPKVHFIPGAGVTASSPGMGTALFALGDKGIAALLCAERAGLGFVLRPMGTRT